MDHRATLALIGLSITDRSETDGDQCVVDLAALLRSRSLDAREIPRATELGATR
jgi:hypothetical protein